MGKIIPLILGLAGLGAGLGAGLVLRPPMEPEQMIETGATTGEQTDAVPEDTGAATTTDYVKLNNQFVVPVVNQGNVTALVVLALSLELSSGGAELIYKKEPKIRDAFLQVLFNHANIGGFDGEFTSARNMGLLRTALLETAQKVVGPMVTDVLIVDVVRQDN